MDNSNTQVAARVALNRGWPSFPVLLLISLASILAFGFLLAALVLVPRIAMGALGCISVFLAAWWWHWSGSRSGPRDWKRVAFIELRDGKIIFVPDPRMLSIGYTMAEAPFPIGSRLEYRVETGGRYFTGDRAQVLTRSLWAVEPTGPRHRLLDSAAYLNLATTARNLRAIGVPFRVVGDYAGQDGKHTEADITSEYVRDSAARWKTPPVRILLGMSSLWLGALAGALIHNVGYVTAVGFLGYAVMAILLLSSISSKRAALIDLVAMIPS